MVDVLEDGSTYTNAVQLNGNPAVRLIGNRITFINTDRGRVVGLNDSSAILEVNGLGSTIINQSGAVISGLNGDYSALAIRGGAGNDTVINNGSIIGAVDLGDGADTIDITLRSESSNQFPNKIYGGSGVDTLILRGAIGVLYASGSTGINGFENLIIDMPFDTVNGSANNLSGLNGFFNVQIGQLSRVNFFETINPDATISMLAGGSVGISSGAIFKSVLGSTANDFISLTSTGQVQDSINFFGGDDTLFLSFLNNSSVQPDSVEGGAGNDTLLLATNGALILDLAAFTGFENINAASNPSHFNLTIRNADNFQAIEATYRDQFNLTGSNSPDAFLNGISGNVHIDSDSEVGRYGFSRQPGFEKNFSLQREALIQLNTSVINDGIIRGEVQLYYGDDIYDGSLGQTGGTIYGYAGNDILKGGAENNVIDGGYGADDLFGNAGADTLLGGDGNDILDGGTGNDTLDGGAGNDRIVYDAVDGRANVSGGSGNDVLVVQNAAAPVGFNLVASGFEAAQRTVNDAGGNSWNQIEDIYNGLWQLTQQSVFYDNGSKLVVQFDIANANAPTQIWNSFDSQSRLSSVDQYFDDGTRIFINLDESNASAVSQDWFTFDTQGRLSSQDVQYDNGNRTFINIDENNSQIWSQVWFAYDNQGRLDTQDVIKDDGSHIFYNYDQDGSQSFTLTAFLYDNSGNAYQQITVWDNGTTDYTNL